MPTPFTHLHIAEQIRQVVGNSHLQANGRLLDLLTAAWPAFYLGSVAPDVQTVSGAPRAQTHFYNIPPAPDRQAHLFMLATYPELADAAALPLAQAIFVAAYSAHLLLDMIWFREIVLPYFMEAAGLGAHDHRRLLHDVLLTYLDKLAYTTLPDTAVATLTAAQPIHWLPFVTDADLIAWRDRLAVQLQPGATLQTIAVYADRLHMSSAEFAACLDDPAWMETNLFRLIPVDKVQARMETAVTESVQLIENYLKPILNNQ